jgi:hypothetical protein
MKKIYLMLALLIGASTVFAQSPRKNAEGEIGGISIAVDYGSPSVKGRTVWGDLEKYDAVWRAGANQCTSVEFSKDAKVNGKSIAAGKYGFFIIPREKGDWTVIFNKDNGQWGAFDYDESKDVLRLDVEPEWSDDVQETLMYSVEKTLNFGWEKARLSLEVK